MGTPAALFKALSEETRVRIVGLLTGGERCVCDLVAILNLPQSTISRHLTILKNAGWVASRRKGVWMYYRLAETKNPLHQGLLAAFRANLPSVKALAADRKKMAAYLKSKPAAGCD
jgi:ArsR family transcriptional regulator